MGHFRVIRVILSPTSYRKSKKNYIFTRQQLAHLEPGRQITPIILRSRRNRYDLIICLFSQPKSSEILFAKFVPLSLIASHKTFRLFTRRFVLFCILIPNISTFLLSCASNKIDPMICSLSVHIGIGTNLFRWLLSKQYFDFSFKIASKNNQLSHSETIQLLPTHPFTFRSHRNMY